jgi:hypothetical protein
MKRIMPSWLAVLLFAGLTGCVTHHGPYFQGGADGNGGPAAENSPAYAASGQPCPGPCRGRQADDGDACPSEGFFHPGAPACPEHACNGRGVGRGAGAGAEDDAGAGGPPMGAMTYPYYTVRGPRDFLAKNPPSIGP